MEQKKLADLEPGTHVLWHGREYILNSSYGGMCELWEIKKDKFWCWPVDTFVIAKIETI